MNQAHNVLSFRLGFRPTCSLLILKFRHGESWEMLAVWALAPVLSHRSPQLQKVSVIELKPLVGEFAAPFANIGVREISSLEKGLTWQDGKVYSVAP